MRVPRAPLRGVVASAMDASNNSLDSTFLRRLHVYSLYHYNSIRFTTAVCTASGDVSRLTYFSRLYSSLKGNIITICVFIHAHPNSFSNAMTMTSPASECAARMAHTERCGQYGKYDNITHYIKQRIPVTEKFRLTMYDYTHQSEIYPLRVIILQSTF